MTEELQPHDLITAPAVESAKVLTIKIPKINLQALILGLVAVVTIFQSFQLYNLKQKTSGATLKSTVNAAAANDHHTESAGNNGALPEMVGGC